MLDMNSSRRISIDSFSEVAFEMRSAVLVGVYLVYRSISVIKLVDKITYDLCIIQSAELGRNNFEEVLEHILSLICLCCKHISTVFNNNDCSSYFALDIVQWVTSQAHAFLHILAGSRFVEIILVITYTFVSTTVLERPK